MNGQINLPLCLAAVWSQAQCSRICSEHYCHGMSFWLHEAWASNQGTYKGTPQFSQALPYSGYQPLAPGRRDGGVYTIGATLASGAANAVSSGLHNQKQSSFQMPYGFHGRCMQHTSTNRHISFSQCAQLTPVHAINLSATKCWKAPIATSCEKHGKKAHIAAAA